VTHLAFTDEGSHFVSCGADGNTFVWSLLGATVAHKLPGMTKHKNRKIGSSDRTGHFFKLGPGIKTGALVVGIQCKSL
jgi:hypothetical protein